MRGGDAKARERWGHKARERTPKLGRGGDTKLTSKLGRGGDTKLEKARERWGHQS